MTMAATATASAMHAPSPSPSESQTQNASVSEAPSDTSPGIPDTPATATAAAMQAPSPEPAPDTPAPKEIHAFRTSDSGEHETLMSSRDIADAEEAVDAPDAAPILPPDGAAASDEVSDPFMTSDSDEETEEDDRETPRQTDS